MIRVVLPGHLRELARVSDEVCLSIEGEATLTSVLDELERCFPVLGGTIRDHATGKRRAFVRFFACCEDWSNEPLDTLLPASVVAGDEPLLVVAAIAGGSNLVSQCG